MRCVLRHFRHERHGGGAAADDHHALVLVIEIFRPFLRMNDFSLKACGAREFRRVAARIRVIAAAHEQEIAGVADDTFLRPHLGFHRPARIRRRPVGAFDYAVKADVSVDAVVARRLAHIFADRRPVGDRFRLAPGLERIAQRVHVGIRTDAGIAEQIPCAADGIAAFEDRIGFLRAIGLQMIGRADARKPGTHNDDVEMFHQPNPPVSGFPIQVSG
jgi:hypothetical protein